MSKRAIDEVAAHIDDSPKRFANLVALFEGNGNRCAVKAAWVMIHVVENHPSLFDPHADHLLDRLAAEKVPDALRRNLTRCYQVAALPTKRLGLLAEICFKQLMSPKFPRAVRTFSFNVLNRIVAQVPELTTEFVLCLNEIAVQNDGHVSVLARHKLKEFQDIQS